MRSPRNELPGPAVSAPPHASVRPTAITMPTRKRVISITRLKEVWSPNESDLEIAGPERRQRNHGAVGGVDELRSGTDGDQPFSVGRPICVREITQRSQSGIRDRPRA